MGSTARPQPDDSKRARHGSHTIAVSPGTEYLPGT
jgi:hypothetical protein